MARTMIGWLAVMTLVGAAAPAIAEERAAAVTTWSGQSFRLSEVSLEVFYTTAPSHPKEEEAGPIFGQSSTGSGSFSQAVATGMAARFGGFGGYSGGGSREDDGKQGHHPVDAVTLSRGGVETRVPLENIASLTFSRQAVVDSHLPPYAAPDHIRYGAAAVMTDGSRIEADYVNLGTTVLRGTTGQGRVEIPWAEIQGISFER